MGAAIAGQIVAGGHTVQWCPGSRSPATHRRAEDAGLRPAPLGDTLSEQHLPSDLALATAAILQHWADITDGGPTDPASILRQLHTHRP